MAGKRLEIEIGVDASDGIKGVKQFSKAVGTELGKVEDDFDDAATSGQKVAKVLGKIADTMDAELKGAAKAAEALKTALGDLGQKSDVSQVVADLKRMGLTFEEIEADADALAASLKKLDDVKISNAGSGLDDVDESARRAKGGIDEVGKSADSSKSVLANMVGNATQDLGSLGGVAGSAGVAIGQMGEYMADAASAGEGLGSIVKSFAGVAGPIAAISIGTLALTKVFGDIQKKNAEIAASSKAAAEEITSAFEQIETSADLGGDGGPVDFLDALSASFVKTQETSGLTLKALADLGMGFDTLGATLAQLDQGTKGRRGFFEDFLNNSPLVVGATDKISAAVAKAIVVGDDFEGVLAAAFNLGGTEAGNFVKANQAVIESLEQIDDAGENISLDQTIRETTAELLRAKGGLDAFTQATNELGPGADKLDVLNRALEIYNGKAAEAQAAAEALANKQRLAGAASEGVANFFEQEAIAQQAAADAAEAHAQAQEDVAAAAEEVASQMQSLIDGFTNSADAQIDAVDAAEAYAESLKDGKKTAEENRDAAVTSAKANVTYAESLAQATGKVLTATDHVDTLNDSLIDNAAQASGPSRKAILDYVSSLNGIPPEKRTEIEAAIAAGDLETAKRLLDEASVPRYAAVIADAETATAEAQLAEAARTRDATINAKIKFPNGTLDSAGRFHPAGGGNVSFQMLPVPPMTVPIAPAPVALGPSQHAAPATSSSSSTSNFAVTINTRANGRDTVRELDRWVRVNGGKRR